MPRAMVVNHPGGPDVLVEVELPAIPVGVTQVRVEVHACGVNPVDAGNRADPAWAQVPAPYVVGYEFAGRIVETGTAVDDLAVGDEIWGLLPVRGTRWGAYSEEVVADASFVGRRPQRLTAIEAAAVPLAGATALQLLDRLDPVADEWILIQGAAGGSGTYSSNSLTRAVSVSPPPRAPGTTPCCAPSASR